MAQDQGCRVVAVVAAAGSGARMGDGPPKQFRLLDGRPLLEHSLETLAGHPRVDSLVLVLPADAPVAWIPPVGPSCSFSGTPLEVVAGGASRQLSVLIGLEAARRWSPDLVLIHDGARPLVTERLVSRVIEGAGKRGAVSPVLDVPDAVRGVDAEGRFASTMDHEQLRLVQTPEGFSFPLILEAARQAQAAGVEADDTATLARLAGHEVWSVPGERGNIKVTDPGDLVLAERLLAGSGRRQTVRAGSGYDAHRLVPGRPLILGGVNVPHSSGLEGHSDADVLLHALADALLGAAALGDLGRHFPESDPALAGVSSVDLLRSTAALLGDAGWGVCNVDVTVTAQRPRLAPYVKQMRDIVARALDIHPGAVSVKATSTEGMGFEGRGEGISARAVALIRRTGE
jgi:2-C-methyl-D-erythritol 4-phosphate cytidylyltransferase/2-C-methyl-D-erythritol 2,4-cyclodiphosphate synthase